MNLIPIDETVSTDSEIYSIVSWFDYTFEEYEVNKDYKILNEFTRNEYTNLYPIDDKYNHYGDILDDLGYNLMENKAKLVVLSTRTSMFRRGKLSLGLA